MKYSILEYFVIFLVWSVCCDSLPIVAWNMLWLEMGVDDRIWYIVGPQNILNKILFERHLTMSTYLIIFRWQESCKSCRWENAKTTS